MAMWCLQNKDELDAQFTEPLGIIEYLNCLNPDTWGVMTDDGQCPNWPYSWPPRPCLSNTCPECLAAVTSVVAGDVYQYSGVPVGSVVREFEFVYMDGQLRGSIITDKTDTNIIDVEVHGE